MIIGNLQLGTMSKSSLLKTRCDNTYCQDLFHPSCSDDECQEECGVCLENLKGKEVAMLNNCTHMFCATCIMEWRGDKKNFLCPYCRQNSRSLIFTEMRFQIQERDKVFNDHLNCHLNSPHLATLLGKVSSEWRSFIEFALHFKNVTQFKHQVEEHAREFDFNILCANEKYAEFQRGEAIKIIINCYCRDVRINIMLTTEELYYDEPDSEFADLAIGCLNRVLVTSVETLGNILNSKYGSFIIWRRFGDVHCMVVIQKSAFESNTLMNFKVENCDAKNRFGRPLVCDFIYDFMMLIDCSQFKNI